MTEIYEEQCWLPEEGRQGVHVDMARHAAGPTDEDIDNMTQEQLQALYASWSSGAVTSN